MRPAQVLKEINELRESWRRNNFVFTSEQRAEFDRLKDLRKKRVKYFHDNDLVFKGAAKKLDKPKAKTP